MRIHRSKARPGISSALVLGMRGSSEASEFKCLCPRLESANPSFLCAAPFVNPLLQRREFHSAAALGGVANAANHFDRFCRRPLRDQNRFPDLRGAANQNRHSRPAHFKAQARGCNRATWKKAKHCHRRAKNVPRLAPMNAVSGQTAFRFSLHGQALQIETGSANRSG
jgi:hypothetical protein